MANLKDVSKDIRGYIKNLGIKQDFRDDEISNFMQRSYGMAIQKTFQEKYGRSPSNTEYSTLFNNLDFKNIFNEQNKTAYDRINWGGESLSPFGVLVSNGLRNQDYKPLSNLFSETEALNETFNAIEPSLVQLQNLRREAETSGFSLKPEDEISILNSPLERAQEISSSILKNARERIVKQRITEIPEEELSAIRKSEQEASETQGKFFEQTITPRIAQMLNARNLLDSGSLSTSLAKAAGELQTTRESVFNPLKTQAKLGGIQRDYENTIRGALEAGKSLSEATSFANNLYTLGQQQKFSAAQSELSRGFQENQLLKQMQFQLANLPRTQSPSSMDYFLQYGLPLTGQIGGGALSGFLSRPKTATV